MTIPLNSIFVIGQQDVSDQTTSLDFSFSRELIEYPVIGGDLKRVVYGERDASVNAEIFSLDIPQNILGSGQTDDLIISFDRTSAMIGRMQRGQLTETDTTTSLRRVSLQYRLPKINAPTDGFFVPDGQLLAAQQSVSAAGALSGVQFAAVNSGETFVVVWSLTSLTGTTPSISFDIDSDTSSAFSLPTVRASVGPLTAASSGVLTIAGPVTDTWWRVNVTAMTGTGVLTVAAGIWR